MKYLAILLIFLQLNTFAKIPNGKWRATLKINDTLYLPFTFTSENNNITFINGDEKLETNEVTISKDSIFIRMPVFDAEFRTKLHGNELTGVFINHARKEKNILSFHAVRGLSFRFSDKPQRTNANITGKYKTVFDGEDDESKVAVGIFEQSGNRVTGTFLTTTGDYRYLEGEMNGNMLLLSTFDGFHLYVFTAIMKNDSLVDGHYYSGLHWHDTWRGKKDPDAQLPAASTYSHAVNSSKWELQFKDENGKASSLSGEKYEGKAVIIQVMGTWCPNCMDETKFLSEWYNARAHKNIEVIALDYERTSDTIKIYDNITRLKARFKINYPVYYYGTSDKKEASKTLPNIDRVFAFPTLIFLDKEKRVVKIHSGFSGPATGEEYEKFKMEFSETIRQLVH